MFLSSAGQGIQMAKEQSPATSTPAATDDADARWLCTVADLRRGVPRHLDFGRSWNANGGPTMLESFY